MKSLLVHLKNKYPHCYVGATGSCIEVIDENDDLIVSLAKDAHGSYVDRQHEVGARDAFCLSPIPKETRAFKLDSKGIVKKDELYDERRPLALAFAREFGKVPSCSELVKHKLVDGNEKTPEDKLRPEVVKAFLASREEDRQEKRKEKVNSPEA